MVLFSGFKKSHLSSIRVVEGLAKLQEVSRVRSMQVSVI